MKIIDIFRQNVGILLAAFYEKGGTVDHIL